MLRDILKESDFYADLKYVNLIIFSLTHQKLRVWEKFALFWKIEGNHPPKVIES